MRKLRLSSLRRKLVALLLAGVLVAPAAGAQGAGNQFVDGVEIAFDVLILRPLGLAATAGGFGVFLATAPLLAPSQEIPYGWDVFVLGPYSYTIERPLGEF